MADNESHALRLNQRQTARDGLVLAVALLAQGLPAEAQGATPDAVRLIETQDMAVRGDLVVRTPNQMAGSRDLTPGKSAGRVAMPAWAAQTMAQTLSMANAAMSSAAMTARPGHSASLAAAPRFADAKDLVVRTAPAPARMPDDAALGASLSQRLTLATATRPPGPLPGMAARPATQPVNLRSFGDADPAGVRGFDANAAAERARMRKLVVSAAQNANRKRNFSGEAASNAPDDTLPRELSCEARPNDRVLELEDAILSAICANPQARGAWANARAAAAALNVARAAYLPGLNMTAGMNRNRQSTTYDVSAFGGTSVTQTQRGTYRQAALDLNWVLYDFGKRAAGKRRASALLDAAGAEYDEALQRVFFNAAQAYYAVQDAQATADAARQAEVVAGAGLAVARARHAGGAGGMSDLLQASTAYRRAQVERVNADGAARAAYGTLAVAMGRDANTPLRIASSSDPETSVAQVSQSVDRLIDTAKAHRPSLEAARARLAAAQADVDAARAQYWPTISLVGRLDKSSNPSTQQALGSAPISGSHSSMIGVQVNIPLTDGITTRYRTAQARAARDVEEASVQDAELQASLDVWRAYQELQADAKNLGNTQTLLAEAIRSLELARGRYKEGIGTLMELLTAQTSQADAQKQRIQAISRWRLGRLRLAQSLGTLGLWDLTR